MAKFTPCIIGHVCPLNDKWTSAIFMFLIALLVVNFLYSPNVNFTMQQGLANFKLLKLLLGKFYIHFNVAYIIFSKVQVDFMLLLQLQSQRSIHQLLLFLLSDEFSELVAMKSHFI
ncbi:hypothetical protein T09_7049 [Trichinella sp. T9]|nr:hypothetical protein T09_7049 [Trichinella sp. T9]